MDSPLPLTRSRSNRDQLDSASNRRVTSILRHFINQSRHISSSSINNQDSPPALHNPEVNQVLFDDEEEWDQENNHFHIHTASSIIWEPSYDKLSKRKFLMESGNPLLLPPVTTCLIVLQLFLYFFREKVQVYNREDVYVSWDKVWVREEYWRLFVAQFFNFTRPGILNIFFFYAIGRSLERKVTQFAMFVAIILMSVVFHMFYILLNPYFCTSVQSQYTVGFANIIFSLRVLHAYALEPRYYERELVFGLYPMVMSMNAAPTQPILDMIIFKIVLPEQCITGQFAGILAGFAVTFLLLIWPFEGVYIAYPPQYWTMDTDSLYEGEPGEEGRRASGNWRMETYHNNDFWLTTPSEGNLDSRNSRSFRTPTSEEGERRGRTNVEGGVTVRRSESVQHTNPLQQKSEEVRRKVSRFLENPAKSLTQLVMRCRGQKEKQKESSQQTCEGGGGGAKQRRTGSKREIKELHKRRRDANPSSESFASSLPDPDLSLEGKSKTQKIITREGLHPNNNY